jgi:hypothetical protein
MYMSPPKCSCAKLRICDSIWPLSGEDRIGTTVTRQPLRYRRAVTRQPLRYRRALSPARKAQHHFPYREGAGRRAGAW